MIGMEDERSLLKNPDINYNFRNRLSYVYQHNLAGPVAVTTPGVGWNPGVMGSASPNRLNPPLEKPPPKTFVGATILVESGGATVGVYAVIGGIGLTEAIGPTELTNGGLVKTGGAIGALEAIGAIEATGVYGTYEDAPVTTGTIGATGTEVT